MDDGQQNRKATGSWSKNRAEKSPVERFIFLGRHPSRPSHNRNWKQLAIHYGALEKQWDKAYQSWFHLDRTTDRSSDYWRFSGCRYTDV